MNKYFPAPWSVTAWQFNGTLNWPDWLKGKVKLVGTTLVLEGKEGETQGLAQQGDYVVRDSVQDAVYVLPKHVFGFLFTASPDPTRHVTEVDVKRFHLALSQLFASGGRLPSCFLRDVCHRVHAKVLGGQMVGTLGIARCVADAILDPPCDDTNNVDW